MKDPSVLLESMLGTSAPSDADFKNHIVKPSIISSVYQYLELYKSCIIVGRPRSGKTILAQYVGWEVLRGQQESLENVRYLDCANIEDHVEQYPYIPPACLKKGWLIIIDNWHARPECQEPIERLISEYANNGLSVIYCLTRFTSEETASIMPNIAGFCVDASPVVDTAMSTAEVAQNMIVHRYYSHLEPQKPSRLRSRPAFARSHPTPNYPQLEDFAQALTASSSHKKIRGNLRFLRWRLAAWNPEFSYFRDVEIDEVLNTFRNAVIVPSRAYLGTLEQIAAVSQWELPYNRKVGGDLPDGIAHLEAAGIVIPISPGTSWRMDSTDAYLLLISNYGESWQRATEELMARYVSDRPGTAYLIINTIVAQARLDIMTELMTSILRENGPRTEVQSILASGVKSGSIGPNRMFRFIYSLARNFPTDLDAANLRSTILHDTLPESLGFDFGRSAAGKGLHIVKWLLIFLDHRPDLFTGFMSEFLRGYGHNNLQTKINGSPSGNTQRNLLRMIKSFDHGLYERIHDTIELKPNKHKKTAKSRCELERLTYWLYLGVLQTHDRRQKNIDELRAIDETYLLETINQCHKPANTLQQLMQAATWLSPEESRRLASLLPSVLPQMNTTGGASSWSYLINNIYSANPAIAEDMVDLVCSHPFAKYLADVPYACGRLLAAMEKAQPGRVAAWVASDEEALSRTLTHEYMAQQESYDHVENIILPLAAFASPSLARICERGALPEILSMTGPPDGLGSYIVRGSLRIAGVEVAQCGGGLDRSTYGHDVAAIQMLAGLFDLNREYCNGKPCNYLEICTDTAEMPSPMILALTQFTHCWNTDDVCSATRKILRGSKPERTRALEKVVLTAYLLDGLEWPSNYEYFIKLVGHRGLRTAVHERILTVRVDRKTSANRASLNMDHPFVINTIYSIEKVLGALDASHKNITEWMLAIPNTIPVMEIDTWRSRLIACGAVQPKIGVQNGSLNITFTKSNVDCARMYEALDLPPPARIARRY